jgi:hypothetical protein
VEQVYAKGSVEGLVHGTTLDFGLGILGFRV